jgi:ribosomal subunit interface protein
MPNTFQLHSHGFENSEALEASAKEHANRLEQYFDGIQSCRVFVTAPSNRHRHGRDFEVRIELTIPGEELSVCPKPSFRGQFEDAHQALNEAFKLAEQQLQKHVHKIHRHELKRHSQPKAAG